MKFILFYLYAFKGRNASILVQPAINGSNSSSVCTTAVKQDRYHTVNYHKATSQYVTTPAMNEGPTGERRAGYNNSEQVFAIILCVFFHLEEGTSAETNKKRLTVQFVCFVTF